MSLIRATLACGEPLHVHRFSVRGRFLPTSPSTSSRVRPFQHAGPGVRLELEHREAWLRRFDDR